MHLRTHVDSITNLGTLGWAAGQACNVIFDRINSRPGSIRISPLTQQNFKTALKIVAFLGDIALCVLLFPVALYAEAGFFVLRNIISFARAKSKAKDPRDYNDENIGSTSRSPEQAKDLLVYSAYTQRWFNRKGQ